MLTAYVVRGPSHRYISVNPEEEPLPINVVDFDSFITSNYIARRAALLPGPLMDDVYATVTACEKDVTRATRALNRHTGRIRNLLRTGKIQCGYHERFATQKRSSNRSNVMYHHRCFIQLRALSRRPAADGDGVRDLGVVEGEGDFLSADNP